MIIFLASAMASDTGQTKKRKARPVDTAAASLDEDSLRPMDIIPGKGGEFKTRPGNTRYHQTLLDFLPLYVAAEGAREKTNVVRQVFTEIKSWGRFVRKTGTGQYVEVPERAAKEIIGKAIRYRQRLQGRPRSTSLSIGTEKEEDTIGATASRRDPPNTSGTTLGNNMAPEEDRKPAAAVSRRNPRDIVALAGLQSAPQQASGVVVGDEAAMLIEFAKEFLASHSEAEGTNVRPETTGRKDSSSESSLFSREELDTVLSVD